MKQTYPLTRDLVLVGGGHTHALVLRMWGMQPLPGVRLTVINPGPSAPYSGMLPGFVAGHYGRDDLDIDLVRLCGFAGARIIDGAITEIDTAARTVTVPGRPPVGYDILSLDIGITSAMPDLPGFVDHGIPAKPLGTFAHKWDAYRTTTRDAQVAVIGGGVAGAELAMAMGHALRGLGTPAVIHLIDRGTVLDGFTGTARRLLLAGLAENGVTLVEDARVAQVDATTVHLADGRHIPSTFTVGAAGAKPYDWLGQTGLTLHHGFVAVDAQLRSSHPTIFAVGDCAHLTPCAPAQGWGFCGPCGPRVVRQPAGGAVWRIAAPISPTAGLPETRVAWRQIGVGGKVRDGAPGGATLAVERPDRPDIHEQIQGLPRNARPRIATNNGGWIAGSDGHGTHVCGLRVQGGAGGSAGRSDRDDAL